MLGETQERFFSRIREAIAKKPGDPPLPNDHELARVVKPDVDLAELFCRRVDESGMKSHRVASESVMVQTVIDLLESENAKSVLLPETGIPSRDALVAWLKDKGISIASPNDPDIAFHVDAGITGVEMAVAETASMSVVSGGANRRLASLAPPCHIAIVRASQMVPDLTDWAASKSTQQPANEVLISGPSKTADIEMTLVQGVHGPGNVHVIVIEQNNSPQ